MTPLLAGNGRLQLCLINIVLQVLQQQLIQKERERILQQIETGQVPAETVVPVAHLFGEDDELEEMEFDEDDMPNIRARKMAAAAQQTRFKGPGNR